MQEMTMQEIDVVSGGFVGKDTAYAVAVGAAGMFLTLGLTVTAPVWGTGLILGASIASSAGAIYHAVN